MMHQQQGAASTAPTFDAPAWFAAWSDHGGIAILVCDRLWVGRIRPLDRRATQTLDGLQRLLCNPGATTALAGLLRANAGGLR